MVSYFPYVALGLVALLGYWYINNLTNAIRDLEAKNASLRSEIVSVTSTLDNVRKSYSEMAHVVRRYSSSVNSMKASVEGLSVKLAKQESRLDKLAKQHPELVAKIVNRAVNERMACITAASKGLRNVTVDGNDINCD